MSDGSKIEWCDTTWNPVTGCTKISQGCKNCYAAELHDRRHRAYLRGAKLPEQYAKPFSEIQLHPERLEMPLHWRKPRRIFVNSTSDLFHEDVPDYFIGMVFAVMALAPHHTFMILTKRPDRMVKIFERSSGEFWGTVRVNLLRRAYPMPDDERSIFPLPNVWLGVSIENQAAADERIPLLLQTPAAVRFVSCEPLLGPVDLTSLYGQISIGEHEDLAVDGLSGRYAAAWSGRDTLTKKPLNEIGAGKLDWVIVGGESGPNARPMHPDWARSIRDQCQAAGVPFFFKQWGEWYPAAAQYDDDDFMDKLDFGTHCICLGNRGTKFREEWGDREEYWCGYQPDPAQNPWFMERIGKKAAGRLLDGVEWNEYPEGNDAIA